MPRPRTLTYAFVAGSGFARAHHEKVVDRIYALQEWERYGFRFVPVAAGERPDVTVHLERAAVVDATCGMRGLSCAEMGGKHIWLNGGRWMHGAPASGLDLPTYRTRLLQHETGHVLGYGHEFCPPPKPGEAALPASIMNQHTKGTGGCAPNAGVHVYDHSIRRRTQWDARPPA